MELQGASGEGPSFYLVPDNRNALAVIHEPRNENFVSIKDGLEAIYIDFTNAPPEASITLGRSNCDIIIPDDKGAGIARQHCYFERHPLTGIVVLHNKSHNKTTDVYDMDDDNAVPISQAMNSVVVTRRFNRCIGLGNKRFYKFRLLWDGDAPVENFLSKPSNTLGPEIYPFDLKKARYIQGQYLGSGGFGFVRRCVDVYTGQAMAIKRYHNLQGRRHAMAIREVNNMLKLSENNAKQHDHILPILDVELDKEKYQWIEIFMPLKEGSVLDLVEIPDRVITDAEIADDVLRQMAKALKFLAKHRLIHRDIKPANILYDTRMQDDGATAYYHFQLADFNLSNDTSLAQTTVGTPIFMAPEVYDRQPQKSNADIWSLFVTIVWIHNVDDFRSYSTDDKFELRNKITDISQSDMFQDIRGMAEQDPARRITARDLNRLLEESSTRAPQTSLESTGSGATVVLDDDEDDGSYGENYGFVPSIPQEVQQGFYDTYGSSSQHAIAGPSMTGHSALAEFNVVGADSPRAVYQNGLMDEAYGYQNLRNTVDDDNAYYALNMEGNTAEDDDDEVEGKGKMRQYYDTYTHSEE